MEITIPKSVAKIGQMAFNGCSKLKNIYCEAKMKLDGKNNRLALVLGDAIFEELETTVKAISGDVRREEEIENAKAMKNGDMELSSAESVILSAEKIKQKSGTHGSARFVVFSYGSVTSPSAAGSSAVVSAAPSTTVSPRASVIAAVRSSLPDAAAV